MKVRGSPLYTVLISVFTAGFSFGIVLPVTSVILEARNVATPLIGITATVMFAGLALGAPLVGRAIELYGIRKTLSIGLFTAGLTIIALAVRISLPYWFFMRFIMGVSFAAIFTSCETLINRVSTDNNRGWNLGLYAFFFSLSLMVGPIGLWLLKFGIWVPFTVGGIVCLVAGILASTTIASFREDPSELQFDSALIRRIRLSLSTMLMAGFMEGALITLIPVFSLRNGFSTEQTAILLFSFMLGHGALPPLIGFLGDRIGLKRVLAVAYVQGIISFLIILIFPRTMSLTVMLVFAGASVGVLYPLAVGLLAQVLTSAELPRGNAMTTFCYGIGSIIGPFFPALIMHVTAPASLFIIAALFYTVVLFFMAAGKQL